jgi:hypothetical protein
MPDVPAFLALELREVYCSMAHEENDREEESHRQGRKSDD